MLYKTHKNISKKTIAFVFSFLLLLVCLLFFSSILLYNTELGYVNTESNYLPLNLIRSINELSIDNDSNLLTTPAVAGTCIYSKNRLLEAFENRGIDASKLSFNTEEFSLSNILNFKCWDRAYGTNIAYFSLVQELDENQEIIIFYNPSPNPIIFLGLFILLLLIKKFIEKNNLKKFYNLNLNNLSNFKKAFLILLTFFASLSIYLYQSEFFKSFTVFFFSLATLLLIIYKRNDYGYDIKVILFIYSMIIFFLIEQNINFLNLNIERDFYQSLKFILRIQNEYQTGFFSNNFYINEIGGGQRLVGQFGNSYLPRIIIFKLIQNFNLAIGVYFVSHLLLSACILYLGINKIFRDKFIAITSVVLYIFSNSFIEWYKITHFPPTILAFSFLIYSVGCIYRNEKNIIYYLSQFLGYLILFHSANIQFLIYVLAIINFLIFVIAIMARSIHFIYYNLFFMIVAGLTALNSWVLFFETFAFSSRVSIKQPTIEFFKFSDFQSLFSLDMDKNLIINGNSDLYFSFLSIFIVLVFTKISLKNKIVKFLTFFTILSTLVSSKNILIEFLLDNISILNSISNYARFWIFSLLFLIILISYIFVLNLKPNKSAIFYLLSFLISLNIVLKIDYYYGEQFKVDAKPSYFTNDNILALYEEFKILVEKNNSEEYRWSAICVSNATKDIYFPNMGLVANQTNWFDIYDSWISERHFMYFNLISENSLLNSNWTGYHSNFTNSKINFELLKEANVKYLLSPKTLCGQSKQLKLVDESDNYFIYELENPKELFTFANKDLKQIDLNISNKSLIDDIVNFEVIENVEEFITTDNSQILNLEYIKTLQLYKIDIKSEGKNLLVFRNAYDPRWEVYVDGEKNQLLNVDLLFMGVLVNEDDSLVEFKFKNSIFR